VSGARAITAISDAAGNYSFTGLASGAYTVTPLLTGYTFNPPAQVFASLSTNQTINFSATATGGLAFFPVTPCRVADTRGPTGFNGQFGAPSMAAGSARSFAVASSTCEIPATAAAYSLNVTVIPRGYLGYLSIWPTGQALPVISTLNSYSGTVVANAAIVPAGINGGISIYVTDAADVLFDINGYFAAPQSNGLNFYTVSPCRIADTRNRGGKAGAIGPPSLVANAARAFPIPSSACGIPSSAGAYSLNVTAMPQGYLGALTTWPTGQTEPGVSTLNSYTGTVVSNAAVVPAGAGGAISVATTQAADVLFDANGYFVSASAGLRFYPVAPCRVAGTRSGGGKTGPLGPPSMAGATTRVFGVTGACNIPSSAQAYSLNVTAVPLTSYLGILTIWPTGQVQPVASTLNSYDGRVVANAAIVPAGSNGAISIYVTDPSDVLFDVNGYFAP
jgi:hypothetical protein